MKQQVENLLITNGYLKITSSLPEFTIYYQVAGGQVLIVHTVDYHAGLQLTKAQYEHIKEQIIQMFRNKGFSECKLFSLFLTSEAAAVREICSDDTMSWILDTADYRLVIYEGQISEFYGLRRQLEDMLIRRESLDLKENEQTAVSRKWSLPDNITPINTTLVLLNIIIFLGLEIFGSTTDIAYMVDHGAMFPPYLREGHQYYRLFICMFLHFGFQHLFSNMIALFFIGDNVERALGKVKYLVLYLVSGFGASSFSLIFAVVMGNDVVSAGASGAIFGVVGALLYIVIRNHGHLEDMTTARVMIMIAYCLFSGFTSQGIDNAAHVGGLITGFLMAVLLYRKSEYQKERGMMNEG